MAFTVPDLKFAFNALEPFIDGQTMQIHHDKHHGAYVANLNKALDGSQFAAWSIEKILAELNSSIPEATRPAVRNNGGGHANHSLFWDLIGPNAGGAPSGKLAEALQKEFGSFDKFKELFSNAALTRFGSGWGWLSIGKDRKLKVHSTANQDSPISDGELPLLGIDVWEHAYYLAYQNRRADYIQNFYNVINWKAVEERYLKAAG
jgi:Fe-Mn family superoxide dismutase